MYVKNDRREASWHVARLDYARWHVSAYCVVADFEDIVYIWEADDRIVAALIGDGWPGDAHPCVDPTTASESLIAEMIEVGESELSDAKPGQATRMTFRSLDSDQERSRALEARGYTKGSAFYQWRRILDAKPSPPELPDGYRIAPVGEGLRLLERCYASGLAFHDNKISQAVENRDEFEWYLNIQGALLYRRDLDLTVVAPSGEVAAFSTVWFDDVTRSGYFEPVATVPAHRKKGLAKAVMVEGLRVLHTLGATVAHVHGGNDAANSLYRSVMGPDYDVYSKWTREWSG